MALRSDFGNLLEPGFRKIFFDGYEEAPGHMEELFHVNTSTKDSEKDSAISGFGYPQETPEAGAVDYEDPVQGFDKTYVHVKYTKGFKVSRELWEDDLYNIIKKAPQALGRSFRRWQERSAAQVFNRAFNSSYLGPNGEELCSTSQDRADPASGGPDSNASSTGITLTEVNLETGINAMRGSVDDKGMRIDAYPNVLLVPIELRKEAREIVESPYKSGTADNDMNIYKGELKVVDWIYMDRVATHWFLVDTSLHELNWFWRIRPEFKQDDTFDTDMALYKARARWSNGWTNYRGIWGSLGDGAAYSG